MAEPPVDPATGRSAGDLRVPVVPVAPRGRGPRRAPLVAAALGVAVIGGFVLAQAFPATTVRPVAEPPSVAVATTPGPTPTPSLPLAAAPRLRAAALVAGVLDGSLDGSLVYADATLRTSCRPQAATTCRPAHLEIDGLGLEVVAGEPVADGVSAVPDGALLVLVVRGPRLEYLGSLIVDPAGSPRLDDLHDAIVAAARPVPPTLYDVRGWLIVNPACITSVNACDAGPFLADDEPLADGLLRSGGGAGVTLAASTWGLNPEGPVSQGPFLVTPANPPVIPPPGGFLTPWILVARYDPARSVRVVIP